MKLFTKYINYTILFVSIIFFADRAISDTVKAQCGKYLFQIKFDRELGIEMQFKLYYHGRGEKKKFFYKTIIGDNFDATCAKDIKGNDILLFQESCGGSACFEGIYGIFDPRQNKLLINPSDWPNGNENEIKKIIGFSPPDLDEKTSFCCTEQLVGSMIRES